MPQRSQKSGASRKISLGGPAGNRRSIDDTSKKVKHAAKAVIAQVAKVEGDKVTNAPHGRRLSIHDTRRKSISEMELSKPYVDAPQKEVRRRVPFPPKKVKYRHRRHQKEVHRRPPFPEEEVKC
ncbi:hypothetical protein MTO96_038957 [Rhipicephalus appendiculatus]